MIRAALSLCLTSRYDDGSSNMYLEVEVSTTYWRERPSNEQGGNLHVGLLDTDGTNGKALELTTREMLDLTIQDVVQLYEHGQ